ncbi:hypothetical protein SAMN05421825_3683 [Epilithonimonas hungarica]|uniref:Uncharacterized protein n=1 Tax=Epilithonimonas hungarica TaxID=454006 RepID=A0A1G7VN64_9FLAO|nr:hypothetical protein [Epilithonimonas hungarica]SDG60998.1 hypothetical protein SAMN05421825_3683 [Epilithonimonas hungarica]
MVFIETKMPKTLSKYFRHSLFEFYFFVNCNVIESDYLTCGATFSPNNPMDFIIIS